MSQFIIPDFIKNKNVNTIHKQMRDNLPKDIDVSEGSDVWNLTYPTAYEHSSFAQFCLLNAIKLIWPEFSYGEYSDYHGNSRGMTRRKSQNAQGYLKIIGNEGVDIPLGSIFSTEQIGNSAATSFKTTTDVLIGVDGTVIVPVVAVLPGKTGNVPADTITVNVDKIIGISSVTNPSPINGGYDEESDESFNERMKEYDQTQDNSFIGNDNDYRRWGMEVVGVGEVVVLDPEDNPNVENDSGIVTLIIIDANGEPASETLCASVYNHIMKPTPLSVTGKRTEGEKTSIERLAPPGVILDVIPPTTDILTITALVELDGTQDIESITTAYVANLQAYSLEAINVGEIRYSKVHSCLSSTKGVADFKDLLLNGDKNNIQLDAQRIPVIKAENIKLTVGLVDG